MQHHERAVETYVERARSVESNLAVVIGGSVARGTERPDSDVDLYLLVTEEEFAAAGRNRRLSYVETEGADYDGGYFDIKLVTLPYLTQAAERGDDPVRASFIGARVVWSRVDDLEERLARIRTVPSEVWAPRMASFLSQLRLYGGYFLPQGAKDDQNDYLRHHAAVHLVGAAGRALLAYNRVLFRGPKYLAAQVAELNDKPAGYEAAARLVLAQPTEASGRELMRLMESFTEWPWVPAESLSTFVQDNELAWLNGTLPPEYS
ncbi:hypothetical protein GCM10009841_20830 [Microlunatus panaciterrae]|uniref:Polymerase nucleotidyl transferase domain-containing protein n=1 Tax=Microlunatus panaciterrae TaxID=400768 RepID=A0ABS2RNP3_9ACTN|nr:nucleotidyltransferase domain-containing protein [Microlunatus panaciterrae]MBM7800635.1 hypothetical protein [Microlunatus panaciterrae]